MCKNSLWNFEIEGGDFAKKRCKRECSNVMCQRHSGKIPCFNPVKMDTFPHSILFFHWALQKSVNSDPLTNYCFKYFCSLKTFENISKLVVFQLM